MATILIVEDDINLNNGLRLALKDSYDIRTAFSVNEAKGQLKETDLVVLDMNLPDGDGLEIIEYIREISDMPIVVLSARDMEVDIISAIQIGADDYITKPFSLAVLQAKIDRIFQRVKSSNNQVYKRGDFNFDFKRSQFYLKDQKLQLTVTEIKLLYYLIESKGSVVTRESLIERTWSVDGDFIDENTLSVNVNRLRKKLEPKNPILTVYGVGYKWEY